jgi:hypothetical protein
MFRHSGAPGPAYYQQQADYKINVELDDKKSKLSGSETTYYNNSPDTLEYFIQLDQNQAAKRSDTLWKPKNGTSFSCWKLQISFKTRTRARF